MRGTHQLFGRPSGKGRFEQMQVFVELLKLGHILRMFLVHVHLQVVLLPVELAAVEALIRVLVALVLLVAVESRLVLVRLEAGVAVVVFAPLYNQTA